MFPIHHSGRLAICRPCLIAHPSGAPVTICLSALLSILKSASVFVYLSVCLHPSASAPLLPLCLIITAQLCVAAVVRWGGGVWSGGLLESCVLRKQAVSPRLCSESRWAREKHGSFVTYLGSRKGIKNGKMAVVVQLNKTSSASLTGT